MKGEKKKKKTLRFLLVSVEANGGTCVVSGDELRHEEQTREGWGGGRRRGFYSESITDETQRE